MPATSRPPAALDLDDLAEAEQRLARTVDGLHDDDWTAPSLLPDWTRAHVVAHLALNGEALTAVLRGVIEADPVPMYPSQEARDADIAELAAADPAERRERLLATLTTFRDVAATLPEEAWAGRFDRTAEGPSLPLAALPAMRLREVEIHHADLGCDYTADDWPPAFSELVIEGMAKRLGGSEGFAVSPLDSERSWTVGETDDDPAVVTGPAAHLAWWLTGRDPSAQVSCSRGDLPTIGAW